MDPDPAPARPRTVLFLDGVRRIDARVWVHGGADAAGAARARHRGVARRRARGLRRRGADRRRGVERGLFTAAPDAADLVTRHGRYPARRADGPGPDKLSLALQQRLGAAEVQLAMAFRAGHQDDDDLLIVDGPLRGRTHLDRTVGYIKTHHASYLPPRRPPWSAR